MVFLPHPLLPTGPARSALDYQVVARYTSGVAAASGSGLTTHPSCRGGHDPALPLWWRWTEVRRALKALLNVGKGRNMFDLDTDCIADVVHW